MNKNIPGLTDISTKNKNRANLSKREYIATECLQGLLSDFDNVKRIVRDGGNVVDVAINYTDELMKKLGESQ